MGTSTSPEHPGARQMGHLRRFMEAHRFETPVPDQGILLDGPTTGAAKVRAARAADGARVIVYTPRLARPLLDGGSLGPFARPLLAFDQHRPHSLAGEPERQRQAHRAGADDGDGRRRGGFWHVHRTAPSVRGKRPEDVKPRVIGAKKEGGAT